MAFTPVTVSKGDQQRVARTAVELTQFRYEGWTEAVEAPQKDEPKPKALTPIPKTLIQDAEIVPSD